MKTLPSIISALLLGTTAVGSAQEATDLEPLVITGTRTAAPAAETGTSVFVITADDLRRFGYQFVFDALAAAPGVTVNQNGAFGGVATVRIRGASSDQTLVLVDGVVVNDPTAPGGGFDFARLDAENVERIEILKGPQSTLWGTDAIGGVINITTKRPEKDLVIDAFAEYGSFETLRAGASVSGAGERGDFRVAVTGVDSDGISAADENDGNTEDDDYDSTTVSMRGGLRVGEAGRLDASVLYTEADTEFDSFVFGAPGNVGDGDELSETEELTANLSYRFGAFDGRLENLLMVGYSDIERDNFSNGAPSFSSEGERMIYRYQGDFSVDDRNHITFGAERDDSEANGEDAAIDGLFALYEFSATDSLTLVAGLRRDDHDTFGSETTGRFSAAWQPNEQVTVRGSWGQGFKAPTIFQTTFFCCGAEAPNPNVVPESSDAIDVGVDYRTADGRGTVGATLFQQDTDDLISFSFTLGGYENIAEAESQGLELSGSYAFTDWLSASVNYAYIDAEDGDGNTLIRVPEDSGDLALSFTPAGRFSGDLLVRYNGEEEDTGGAVDSWTRVDLAARYALSDGMEVFGRIENLLDEEYQQVPGYGTPDLSGYLGFRMRF